MFENFEHNKDNMDIDMIHIQNKYQDRKVCVMYTLIDLHSLFNKEKVILNDENQGFYMVHAIHRLSFRSIVSYLQRG